MRGVTPQGVRKRADALLPYITERYLGRRFHFKRLRKSYEKGSQEWLWCEQRQSAIKSILVTPYGTSGCCWNRFGNV
jgi:DNA polymerase elongation subunit (family B)